MIASQKRLNACFRFSRKTIAFSPHSARIKAIANLSATNAIAFLRFSHKAIASPSYSAQVEEIANLSPTNAIAFLQFSQKLARSYHI
jgi:hypothetical protein